MSSVYTHRYDSADHQRLGANAARRAVGGAPIRHQHACGRRDSGRHPEALLRIDEALAHLSSRGIHRLIKGSRHHIQLDKPQEVIDAVDEVLSGLKNGKIN